MNLPSKIIPARSAMLYAVLLLVVLIVPAFGNPGRLEPARADSQAAALEKLMNIEVPLMVFVLDALEEECLAFNLLNTSLTEPVFDSVRWDLAREKLVWRFWVGPEGALAEDIRNLPRPEAVAKLRKKMENLALITGVEPHPGFKLRMGALGVFRIPASFALTEEEITQTRDELAAVSIIQLAAAHTDGPVMLSRMPGGRINEENIEVFGKPVSKTEQPGK